jgi:hypothetical protein
MLEVLVSSLVRSLVEQSPEWSPQQLIVQQDTEATSDFDTGEDDADPWVATLSQP